MLPTDILPALSPAVALFVLHALRDALPPPALDTQDGHAARDEVALAAVAGLFPANAAEALFAVQIITADAVAKECARLAFHHRAEPRLTLQFSARAAVMMRLAQSGLRALQRMQALREKAEAAMQPAAMQAAGYWFRDCSVPAPEPEPEPEAMPPEPEAAPAPAAAAPAFEALTEAEQYAVVYPERAALIRAHGGLPPRLDFGPPAPALVEALVTGTSQRLLALDQKQPAMA